MPERSEFACHLCFDDRALRTWIKDESKRRGRCAWCCRIGALIPLTRLSEPFRAVADFYREASGPPSGWEQGEQLGFLLNDNWGVFSEAIQIADLSQELAVSILRADLYGKERYDHPDYDGLFIQHASSLEEHWDSLAIERLEGPLADALDVKPIIEDVQGGLPTQLATAFEDLAVTMQAGTVMFRARVHDERKRKERYSKSEVGPPPDGKAKAGRANRKGHPVFYMSTNPSTALAEVRSWKGAAVALARLELSRDLLLVDLAQAKRVESPFFSDLLKWEVDLAALLARLSDDMSRPVMPQEEEILYRPTQLLAMAIRAAGYDGFRYPSAMGSGKNVALFHAGDAAVLDVGYVRIKRAAYFWKSLGDHEDPYDEGPYDFALPK
jgi:RES domain-containing protein